MCLGGAALGLPTGRLERTEYCCTVIVRGTSAFCLMRKVSRHNNLVPLWQGNPLKIHTSLTDPLKPSISVKTCYDSRCPKPPMSQQVVSRTSLARKHLYLQKTDSHSLDSLNRQLLRRLYLSHAPKPLMQVIFRCLSAWAGVRDSHAQCHVRRQLLGGSVHRCHGLHPQQLTDTQVA